MIKHYVLALSIILGACGLQEDGSSNDEPTCDTCGVDDDAGTPETDSGVAVVDSGSPETDSGVTVVDSGSPEADAGTPVVPPPGQKWAPSPITGKGCIIYFSAAYVEGSDYADIRGDAVTNLWSWDFGPYLQDADGDGYYWLDVTSNVTNEQILRVTYRDREAPGQLAEANYALYGSQDQLHAMSPEGRAFLYCNWWNTTTQVVIPNAQIEDKFPVDGKSDNPGCIGRARVLKSATSCTIVGAGNMANFK